ncbi:hypothetical protein ACFFX1_13300 [Dactylosporangium sucinum]|uniref:Uncharacterized protein n=1 Tax=Dactylosporangium sucinum TaxID=1424081 RepID=A0A917UDG6_9ACTN|nr:hypothetical protein [Dactylosporangium sucinum]GGM73847.1 hypothetical protein GCM10007977_089260 [Dactylosporangium sucinum]
MKRKRVAGLFVLLVSLGVILPGSGVYPAPTGEPEPEFTATKSMTRAHLRADGTDEVVDQKNVTVTVSQISNLRNNQQVRVRWTGAHPTHATGENPNTVTAYLQEYPVVVMQCRGVDTAQNPLTPETCWTQSIDQRRFTSYLFTQFPPWRMDRYETAANRKSLVGVPSDLPKTCDQSTINPPSRFVPFRGPAPGNIVYNPLQTRENVTCGPVLAPDMVNVEDKDAPPANTTFGATNHDGEGLAKFVVQTNEHNPSMSCSMTTLCSLVVIPIMGISCDPTAAALPPEDRPTPADLKFGEPTCRGAGKLPENTRIPINDIFQVDAAVTGTMWWSASNWRNRISVPITFGPPANLCEQAGSSLPLDIFGSEMLVQATDQWSTAFCTDPSRFKFRHVRLNEPQAKAALVASGAQGAFASLPPDEPYPIPVVSSPVAITGFAISYLIDDDKGNEYTDLKLTPRLLAKLLTQSYPTRSGLRTAWGKASGQYEGYKALAKNPLAITQDPEFRALNPAVPDAIENFLTSSTVLALSANSDVMWSLSAYIDADPEARAWLDGEKDPWDMVVNPNYKGIDLPLSSWPLLDNFVSADFSSYGGCPDMTDELAASLTPIPYLPLVASPVASLANISQRVQYALSNAHVNCTVLYNKFNIPMGVNLGAWGRQSHPRFMLGVTTLADAAFLQLNTAALQSYSSVPRTEKITNRDGRTFVEPTDDSMKAAMKFVKADATTNTWRMQYDKLVTADAAGAYPGTMPVYAVVPTANLAGENGKKLAQLLRFAADEGQSPGLGSGQLPPGYLPMTDANGFGDFRAYALRAADAVAAQTGQVPLVVPAAPAATTSPPAPPPPASNGGGSSPTTSALPETGSRPSGSASPSPSAAAVPQSAGFTALLSSGLAAWALPIAALIALSTFLIGSVTRAVTFVVTWWKAT